MRGLLLLMIIPLMLSAQPEFFGYFESEADVMSVRETNYNFGYNKLRLDLEARPNDNILIGANMNIQQYWGQTTWNVFDFIPGYANSGYVENIQLTDTLFLDNFYMKLSFSLADLTLGKQQISPGVGYAWNPTDIFNAKTLMDPTYEQTGVSSIRLDLPFGNRSNLSTIIIPVDDWAYTTRQYWLKSGINHFDFELTMAQLQWPMIEPCGYEVLAERTLVGGSLVGELIGWGIWAEYAYNMLDDIDDPPLWSSCISGQKTSEFSEVVLGIDHTFDNSIYILAEYFHNGFGAAHKTDLSISDYIHTLGGMNHSLMQDYAFIYLMHQTFDFVSLSTIAIANLNDQSGTLGPQIDWNIFEDTNISIQGSYSWGNDDSEFGLQDWGLRLRILNNF